MVKQIVIYIYDGILFSHKKEEITLVLIHATTRMNPGNIMLSERSQTQKGTHYMILFM